MLPVSSVSSLTKQQEMYPACPADGQNRLPTHKGISSLGMPDKISTAKGMPLKAIKC